MVSNFLSKIFGSRNERLIKRLSKVVVEINTLEAKIASLSDADLRARTDQLRQRLAEGATLQDILPEAFANTS